MLNERVSAAKKIASELHQAEDALDEARRSGSLSARYCYLLLCYSACFGLAGTLAGGCSFLVLGLKGNEMRLSLLAALLVAVWALPAEAARPVKGAVQGTATAATGVARGAGQVGVGIVRGTSTAVRGTARGLRCVVTLGNRC